jgi:3-hydroxyacyl-CoA dehydrogenase
MKMGFNWIRGPFEMIDALGADVVIKLAQDAGCTIPQALQTSAEHGPFYQVQDATLMVRNFDQTASDLKPVQLPDGTERFSLTRRTSNPHCQQPRSEPLEPARRSALGGVSFQSQCTHR